MNGQYGFGLSNRNSATVTQQGIIDAIMSAVGSGPAQPSQRHEAETGVPGHASNSIRLDPTTAAGLVNVDRLDVGAAFARGSRAQGTVRRVGSHGNGGRTQ